MCKQCFNFFNNIGCGRMRDFAETVVCMQDTTNGNCD